MKNGFTLAEVLITLGIIGVVAALTLPVLTASYRKHEVVTKLERAYSILNQAVKMSEAEYGDVEGWFKDCGLSGAPVCSTQELTEWFNEYLGKHMQIIKTEINERNNGINVYLNDGSILEFPNFIYDIGFYINKKAMDNPQNGRNLFYFRFNPILLSGQDSNSNKLTINKSIEPYAWSWDGTREGLINASNGFGCSKEQNKMLCGKLIQYEGWKIPDDYPIKF